MDFEYSWEACICLILDLQHKITNNSFKFFTNCPQSTQTAAYVHFTVVFLLFWCSTGVSLLHLETFACLAQCETHFHCTDIADVLHGSS